MSVKVKMQGESHELAEEYQYSSSEPVFTGRRWTDGSKIYESTHVISGSTSSSANTKSISMPSWYTKIKQMISMRGIWQVGTITVGLPRGHIDNSNDGIQLQMYDSFETLRVVFGASNSGGGYLLHYPRVHNVGIILKEGWC